MYRTKLSVLKTFAFASTTAVDEFAPIAVEPTQWFEPRDPT